MRMRHVMGRAGQQGRAAATGAPGPQGTGSVRPEPAIQFTQLWFACREALEGAGTDPWYALLSPCSAPWGRPAGQRAQAHRLVVAPGVPSATYAPDASWCTVNSTSPRIMPWDTSRWKGSGVDTAPMSNSTCTGRRGTRKRRGVAV